MTICAHRQDYKNLKFRALILERRLLRLAEEMQHKSASSQAIYTKTYPVKIFIKFYNNLKVDEKNHAFVLVMELLQDLGKFNSLGHLFGY